MKITEIKTFRLLAAVPTEGQVHSRTGTRRVRNSFLVEVQTDAGFTGIGSCSGPAGPIVEVIIDKVFKPVLIGEDPSDIEALWEKCYFGAGVKAFGSRGPGVVALGAIDIAPWDIRGKRENLPLYKLLSKTPREAVSVYATALYPEEINRVVQKARALAEQGFRGLKIKIGFNFTRDMEIVKAVRTELGNDFTIITDANMGYERDVALRAAAVLHEYKVAWLEEPLFLEDIEGHAYLRTHGKLPISVGENLHTRFAFENYIARKAVDVLQPNIARAGGISETLKIAAMAEQHGLPVSLHTFGDAITLAASLHVAAALPNAIIMENDYTYNALRTELTKDPPAMKNGAYAPPEGPGLGLELDDEARRRYLFTGDEEINFREKALSVAD